MAAVSNSMWTRACSSFSDGWNYVANSSLATRVSNAAAPVLKPVAGFVCRHPKVFGAIAVISALSLIALAGKKIYDKYVGKNSGAPAQNAAQPTVEPAKSNPASELGSHHSSRATSPAPGAQPATT